MPYTVVQLGPVTFSSGGTSILANGLVDDASNLFIWASVGSTSPITINVEPTDTGTNFVPLTAGQVTSSGSNQPLIAATSQGYVISNIAFRQMKFTTTAGCVQAATVVIAKQITV